MAAALWHIEIIVAVAFNRGNAVCHTINLEILAEKIFSVLGVTDMLANINFSDWQFTEKHTQQAPLFL